MARLTVRITPTQSERAQMSLRWKRRSFFVRLTQPLYRARLNKLMLAKMGWRRDRDPPFGGAPI